MQEKVEVQELLSHEVRPRFQLLVHSPAAAIIDTIQDGLQDKRCGCEGKVDKRHVMLYLPASEQHYWSPQLSLNLQEEEDGTLLRGLYGPRPAVWTMFVFFYALIGFTIMIVAVIGLSQLSLGKSGMILWAVPILLLVFFSLYLVAYFGKKTGREQMLTLHHFLEKCLGVRIGEEK